MDTLAWIIAAPMTYLAVVCVASGVQARRRELARGRHPSARRIGSAR